MSIRLKREEYIHHPINHMGKDSFALTAFLPSNDQDTYTLLSIFNRDILMTPYYGELLVIHENEMAIQFLEVLEQSETAVEFHQSIPDKLNHFEVRAYYQFIKRGFELFPFLRNYPYLAERADVIEAKKMFICYALTGFGVYLLESSPEQLASLEQMADFKNICQHVETVISVKNSAQNLAIMKEMDAKYKPESLEADLPVANITDLRL